MKKALSLSVKIFIVVSLVATFYSSETLAQNTVRQYSVSPLIIDINAQPRDIIKRTIKIENRENRQLRLYATVNEVAVYADGTLKDFTTPSMTDGSNSITSWLSITRGRIQIPANETHEVDLNIKIHPHAKPGEYHAFIGIASGSNQPAAEALVKAGQAPGVMLRIAIDEEPLAPVRLERFFIDRFVTNNQLAAATIAINNPAENPQPYNGEIIFYDTRGREVGAVPVSGEGGFNKGRNVIEFEIPPNLRWGRHKAFLSIQYGENFSSSITDTDYFYMIPIMQLIILFILMLLLTIAISYWYHRRQLAREYIASSNEAEPIPLVFRNTNSTEQDHDVDLRTNSKR